jgi:hypothetical protein
MGILLIVPLSGQTLVIYSSNAAPYTVVVIELTIAMNYDF